MSLVKTSPFARSMNAPWFQLPNPQSCGWGMTDNDSADGKTSTNSTNNSTAIIGAGIAGLCAARALLKQGHAVTVYEAAADCAAGASGSPAGIIKPYVTRQPSDAMRFYTEAYRTLFRWLAELDNNGGLVESGALQRVSADREFPANDGVYDDLYKCLDAEASSAIAGIKLQHKSLQFKSAGWLSVHTLCHTLLADVQRLGGKFIPLHRLQDMRFDAQVQTWSLLFNRSDRDHNCNHNCDHNSSPNKNPVATSIQLNAKTVLLTTGAALSKSKLLSCPEMIPARGQITEFARTFPLNTVISGNHYVIPSLSASDASSSSVWVGATFDRNNDNAQCREADDAQNRLNAAELLEDAHDEVGDIIDRFAGVRCTTLDRLPLLGPVPDTRTAINTYHDLYHGRSESDYPTPTFHRGLAVIGGLGSRGIALAPYAAELFTDWVSGGGKLEQQNRLISPLRFTIRNLKRRRP